MIGPGVCAFAALYVHDYSICDLIVLSGKPINRVKSDFILRKDNGTF